MNPIIQLIIEETPSLIALIREKLRKKDPNAPTPTSEEVIAAFEQAYADSYARDEMLKAALQAEIAGGQ